MVIIPCNPWSDSLDSSVSAQTFSISITPLGKMYQYVQPPILSQQPYSVNVGPYAVPFTVIIGPHGKMYQCKFCPYSAVRAAFVKNHQVKHTKEQPFDCSVCSGPLSIPFMQPYSVAITPNGKPLYHCKICSYSSTRPNHVMQPSGQTFDASPQPYSISVGTVAVHRSDLSQQPYNICMGLVGKEYYCKTCPYSTTKLGNMKLHQVKHTGERPYACNLCGKTFGYKSNLNSHRITVHYMKT
ncbi:hypothetical protein CDAR_16951 [Caerostris darwini]|uniref:C2H2-type domain-containing protein n=1 Tax=Caerostris darwini TaxID=1538125 RepID=A0AAV4PMF2_9ARAC|nr:hypothetical protein CDAR_16951 [Caerostris darwini]